MGVTSGVALIIGRGVLTGFGVLVGLGVVDASSTVGVDVAWGVVEGRTVVTVFGWPVAMTTTAPRLMTAPVAIVASLT